MKAAVYYGQRDIRVQDVAPPIGRIGPREALIRPLYAGICGTDVHEYANGPDLIPAGVPQILGHELSAEVVDVGDGVTGVRAGDLVAVRPGVWCGRCEVCLSGYQTSCPSFSAVGLGHPWGGLAELAVVDAGQLHVMPDGVSARQAALLEPLGVASVAFDHTGVKPGGTLLITGGGPIGTLAALYAHAAGVGEIILSEPNPSRRGIVDELGVARVVDPRDAEDIVAQGVDAGLEASGHPAGLDLAIRAVRPGANVVQVGLHGKDPVVPVKLLNYKQATLVGSWCWPVTSWVPNARLIAQGRLPVEKLITAEIDLDDLVPDGIEALLDPAANHQKILIRIQ